MTESQRLLAEYVATGSEPAFRELVSRYLDLVYSSAVRLVDGDAHLAEDVAQTVFIDLARSARTLSTEVMLGGWLHRHTCFVAAKLLRSERRRQLRERQVLQMNEQKDHTEANLAQLRPLLDDAINRLGAEDRAAILLRFFEQRDFRSIGEMLGSNEDATQKRVARALEKLRVLLSRRGVALSAATLGTTLATEAVSAAPLPLVGAISSAAVAGTAVGTGSTLTLIKIMAMTKLQATITGAIVIAGVTASLLIRQRTSATLREQDDSLRQQSEQLARLNTDNGRLRGLLAGTNSAVRNDPSGDLRRLRGEAELLRARTNDLGKLREENRQLRRAKEPSRTPLQDKELQMAKMTFSRNWVMACINYDDKYGHFPETFDKAAPFRPKEVKPEAEVMPEQFEIVYHGTGVSLGPRVQDVIVVREKEPWFTHDGRWVKVYGMADGSSQLISMPFTWQEADGRRVTYNSFEELENKRIPRSGVR